MARFDIHENQQAASQKKYEKLFYEKVFSDVSKIYGDHLGLAMTDYLLLEDPDVRDQARLNLAEVLVDALNGERDQQLQGMDALLTLLEIQTGSLSDEVRDLGLLLKPF